MAEAFKDAFDEALVARYAAQWRGPSFDEVVFLATVGSLDALPLKQRTARIADAMAAALPPFPEAVRVIRQRLPPRLSPEEGMASNFTWWPLLSWVERHGPPHPDLALPLLRELTGIFSAEFAIRPFLLQDLPGVLERLGVWALDPDPHVRRLVSEGTRSRLPWGIRLAAIQANPQHTLPLLDALVDDPDEVVRRSVANHLGDIAKDHPDLAVDVGRRWLAARPDRERLVRHGLRHLLKGGHEQALALFGFAAASLDAELTLPPAPVVLGGTLTVQVTLRSTVSHDQALHLDLAVRFRGANGSLRAAKVFRWTDTTLRAGEVLHLSRSLPLRAVTTRSHHPGEQHLALQINGQRVADAPFHLVLPE